MTAATIKQAFDNAETVNLWAVPDRSILNGGRRDPVPMPSGLFGPAWPLLQAIAEGVCTPVDYPAAGFLSACASLIGGKRSVRPYSTARWAEPCILWIGVVGDPSARKSPALDAITAPLRAIERANAELHKDALREWRETSEVAKAEKKAWQDGIAKALKDGLPPPPMPTGADEPDEPIRRRTLVMDATPEAMGSILAGNPQGTLHFRDELAGWLTSFERYAPGGREFWLEAFGGRPFVIDRKGASGPLMIPFNGVSVCGGIQPSKLATALLDTPDDGLVPRFIWSWPEKLGFVRRPREAADIGALEAAYQRLEGIQWGQDPEGRRCAVTLPLSDDAADLFERWQQDNAAADEDASALFKSFVGKMDGAVLRLALIGEFIRWAWEGGQEPGEVSVDSLFAAAEFVDDYAKAHALRVYGDAALPLAERNAAILARYIVKKRLRTINLRELKQSPHKSALPALRTKAAMDDAVACLVDGHWLRPDMSREGGAPGQPRLDYVVNPAALGG
jgi:putative DNA primase/helicase